jgi:hypothetical protein
LTVRGLLRVERDGSSIVASVADSVSIGASTIGGSNSRCSGSVTSGAPASNAVSTTSSSSGVCSSDASGTIHSFPDESGSSLNTATGGGGGACLAFLVLLSTAVSFSVGATSGFA